MKKEEEDRIDQNAQGAKQSFLGKSYNLIPQIALSRVAQVFYEGAKKYGVDNWRGLGDELADSIDTNLNHALYHINQYLINKNSQNDEDLSHAVARTLMALEMWLSKKGERSMGLLDIWDDPVVQKKAQEFLEAHGIKREDFKSEEEFFGRVAEILAEDS